MHQTGRAWLRPGHGSRHSSSAALSLSTATTACGEHSLAGDLRWASVLTKRRSKPRRTMCQQPHPETLECPQNQRLLRNCFCGENHWKSRWPDRRPWKGDGTDLKADLDRWWRCDREWVDGGTPHEFHTNCRITPNSIPAHGHSSIASRRTLPFSAKGTPSACSMARLRASSGPSVSPLKPPRLPSARTTR